MTPVQRDLVSDVHVLNLGEELELTDDAALVERSGRNARTLIKDGPLRITLVVLGAGGLVAEHDADGPATVQPLQGRIRLQALGREYEVGPGELVSLRAGVRHAVASDEGAAFLLTIALRPPVAE